MKNDTLIIDGDYPMTYGALDLNRELTRPIDEVRKAQPIDGHDESSILSLGGSDAGTMASLPEMRRAGIAAALVKICRRIYRPGSPMPGFRSGEQAYAAAQADLAYYRILESLGHARILQTGEDLRNHMLEWSSAGERSELPVGMFLGLEGGDPILWPEQIHSWWNAGVRVVSLSHYGISTYCHGTSTGTSGGLFQPAKELLGQMESLGMILDVTHASDQSIIESLELFSGPVIASHHNCRALVPGERQLPDSLVQEVIRRDGVIGVSMDTWMLYRPGVDWTRVPEKRRDLFPRSAITLDDLADHIDHVCQLAGDSRHVGIGGDTDGQGGSEGAPAEIDTVADYQKLAEVLIKRGYNSSDVANIMYGNWQQGFEKWLP